jgi:hypothetical protein
MELSFIKAYVSFFLNFWTRVAFIEAFCGTPTLLSTSDLPTFLWHLKYSHKAYIVVFGQLSNSGYSSHQLLWITHNQMRCLAIENTINLAPVGKNQILERKLKSPN